MGLAGNRSPMIYFSINDGKFARRVLNKTESSKERTLTKGPNSGKVIFEEYYDHISGKLKGIELTQHNEWGEFINLYMEKDGEIGCIQMQLDSGYGVAFMKTMPNVDATKEFTLIPFIKEEGGKKKGTLFINQGGGKALKRYYTNEHPNGMPQPKSYFAKGKENWDYFDQLTFLKEKVIFELQKLFGGKPEDGNKNEQTSYAKPNENVSAKNTAIDDPAAFEDDLPF
jgi:hypothetical protein